MGDNGGGRKRKVGEDAGGRQEMGENGVRGGRINKKINEMR